MENSPTAPIAHLFLDATYTKARLNGVIADCAVFVAVGIEAETGRRIVLGVSVGLSDAAENWSTFIQSLIMRGMNRPPVTSDDHMGSRAALARTLTGVLWQRCQFHFQQNAQAYITTSRYKTIAAAHIRTIFNAGSRKMANIMESINRQLKRRTNVISIFPSEASLLRIVTAKAMDLSDEWEGLNGKAYISPEKLQQTAEVLKAASSQPKNSAA